MLSFFNCIDQDALQQLTQPTNETKRKIDPFPFTEVFNQDIDDDFVTYGINMEVNITKENCNIICRERKKMFNYPLFAAAACLSID